MTKSDNERVPEDAKELPPETSAWGTWEELLLAYAVNRYGTDSWDSISSELRKRSSAPIHLTPHHCERKYGELKRRFNQSDVHDVVMDDATATATTTATVTTAIPWLEKLRKLRVLELQRELQNYDLYISSLQSKVKKLTEESEKNGGDTKKKSKLGHRNDEIEPETTTPEPVVSGDEEFDRDSQSVNGSNGNLESGVEKPENENEASPVGYGDEKPESTTATCDGTPEGEEPVKTEPDGEASESPESIAESKSEGKNSDVQSSASKSRKERNDWVRRGFSKADEQDQSTDSVPVRSLPLVDFLQKLQKLGLVLFERRLDRQEKIRYKKLIKQHIDYETLQSRLKEGWYSDGNDKFFRDLLLLVSNTRVFFPKQSPESTAAVDLRHLILNEMITKKKQKPGSKLTNKQTSSKRPADPPDHSLFPKPESTRPIVVCRKRSSIKKKGQTDPRNSEKLIEENPKKSGGFSPVNEGSGSDTKPDKKKKLTEAEEKKQSAAKFLNRMKRSNNGGSENKGGGGGGSKKGSKVEEQGSPAKRSVGRPPKRAAAPPPLAAVLGGKRNRESVDSETVDSKQTKKRSKR